MYIAYVWYNKSTICQISQVVFFVGPKPLKKQYYLGLSIEYDFVKFGIDTIVWGVLALRKFANNLSKREQQMLQQTEEQAAPWTKN